MYRSVRSGRAHVWEGQMIATLDQCIADERKVVWHKQGPREMISDSKELRLNWSKSVWQEYAFKREDE